MVLFSSWGPSRCGKPTQAKQGVASLHKGTLRNKVWQAYTIGAADTNTSTNGNDNNKSTKTHKTLMSLMSLMINTYVTYDKHLCWTLLTTYTLYV